MDHRERVLTALNHKTPDRVPIDFNGTTVSGMHVTCVAALRDYYGLEKRPVTVYEPHQMLGWLDEDLLQILGVDVAAPMPPGTAFGFPNENWKTWRMPGSNLEVLVPEKFNTIPEANGDILMYPQGDKTALPSGRMPSGGFYFDAIIRQEPIEEARLNPEDNLEEFGVISDEEIKILAARLQETAGQGRAVVGRMNGTALGDISRVPALHLRRPKGIRDISEWYMSLALRQDYLHAVFSRQTEIILENLKKLNAAAGNYIDVFNLCGADFGTQNSTFFSLDTFRTLFMPYYRQVTEWIHSHTHWKVFKHSCGAIAPFIPAFIECGFDILNPVQCSAAGMEPQFLKSTYGDRIVFWGGGVDTQRTLPFGTPEAVRAEVLQRCEIFSPNGGFIFNAVHNMQANTPVVNIVAMIDAVKEYNGIM